VHQRLVVSNSSEPNLTRSFAVTHPCLVCGPGSGVVFPSRDMLCEHLLEHLYSDTVQVPASSALGEKMSEEA
jgi:hypothetical protein